MNWLTIVNAIISYAWLAGTLWFLWRIVVTLEKWLKPVMILADVAMKDAESARKAVEMAREVFETPREKK